MFGSTSEPFKNMEKKAVTKPRKIPGQVSIHMKIDDKNEWNFTAASVCEAIDEGQRLCLDNNVRWQDVTEWDIS